MPNPTLPKEIMIEIFSRMPTKSVGKCRCLSKSWYSHLSTSQFINSHLKLKNQVQEQQNVFLITPSHSLHTIAPPLDYNDQAVSTKLEMHDTWTELVGSCNGLILLLNDKDELFLINPVTNKNVRVQDNQLASTKGESFRMYGFGYDSYSDDYKIVALSYEDAYYNESPSDDCNDTFVDVYSVKSRVWKRVDTSPYDHAVPKQANGVFVNGAIHWLACYTETYPCVSVIAAFDLNSDEFQEIPPPCSLDGSRFVFNRLFVLGGRLGMIDDHSGPIDVWIMDKYGVEESWMKLISISEDHGWEGVKPLCFVGGEEIVLAPEEEESLVVYNVRDGTKKDLVVDGVPAHLIDGCTFVDSLVSFG